MSRESIDEKALRYIREGRLRVVLVDGERIQARVRGSDAEHVCGYARGGWICSCEANAHRRRCCHLAALQMVTVRPSRKRPAAAIA